MCILTQNWVTHLLHILGYFQKSVAQVWFISCETYSNISPLPPNIPDTHVLLLWISPGNTFTIILVSPLSSFQECGSKKEEEGEESGEGEGQLHVFSLAQACTHMHLLSSVPVCASSKPQQLHHEQS